MKLMTTNSGKSFIRSLLSILLFFSVSVVNGQTNPGEPPPVVEQQLENLTESSDDNATEDDSYLQQLFHFVKDPINLNYTGAEQLEELKLLSPLQINNFFLYRNLLGNFLNIYELQAIPGWTISLIRKLLPYVTVSIRINAYKTLGSRLKNGENTLLIRLSGVLEKSKGYLIDSSVATNFYNGSRQKILFRYKYVFKNLLQYGVTAEKDAGEQFFRGAQKSGFDFYSAHFFAKNIGIIKTLAIGDFTVNLGQGLIEWQSLAFKKSADVLNIKRQSDVLRPYNSAGEIIFNRGAGITLQKNKWEATGFISYRKIDENFVTDTVNFEGHVTSLTTSGYHRTANELADKNSQGQLSFGGNINYSANSFHMGLNAVHYKFKYKIEKAPNLYNRYALSGNTTGNYSIDYSYTYKNMHFFGEAATDETLSEAFVNGLLISADSHVDMSFVYRKISRSYKSIYTNAFTESTVPANESGFYSGITIKPVDFLRIDAYADFYNFPWLKYRVDAPSSGSDYLIQLTYKPNKNEEVYARYHSENKAINYNPEVLTLNPVIVKPKQDFRMQFSYKISTAVTFRSRVELSWFDKKALDNQKGFLIYTDLFYKPLMKRYSANIRLQYFETGGYDSRLYAYENDVLYSYSIPVFFDKGYRYYLNYNIDLSKNLSCWIRISQTIYPDKNTIGSGLDLIKSSSKSEIRFQGIYSF